MLWVLASLLCNYLLTNVRSQCDQSLLNGFDCIFAAELVLSILREHLLAVTDAVDLQIKARINKVLVDLGDVWILSFVELERKPNFETSTWPTLKFWLLLKKRKRDLGEFPCELSWHQWLLIHSLGDSDMVLLRIIRVAMGRVQGCAWVCNDLLFHFILKNTLHRVIFGKHCFHFTWNRYSVHTQMPLGTGSLD